MGATQEGVARFDQRVRAGRIAETEFPNGTGAGAAGRGRLLPRHPGRLTGRSPSGSQQCRGQRGMEVVIQPRHLPVPSNGRRSARACATRCTARADPVLVAPGRVSETRQIPGERDSCTSLERPASRNRHRSRGAARGPARWAQPTDDRFVRGTWCHGERAGDTGMRTPRPGGDADRSCAPARTSNTSDAGYGSRHRFPCGRRTRRRPRPSVPGMLSREAVTHR
jgi:hypothetical protein